MNSHAGVGSSARLAAFGALCGVAWVLGLVARNSLTISLAQALLLLGVWSYVLCRGSLARLSCYRECPEIVDAGQSVDVRLTVTNQGWLPGYLVEVTDWFPADRQPLKRMLLSGLAPRARAASVGYQAVCNAGRGVYQLAPLELATSDPLGLFRARRVVSLEQEVVVYPQPLSSLPVNWASLAVGDQTTRAEISRSGRTTNPLGTREYRGGATVRHIHWRASARRERLVVKEFESGTGMHLSIFLDLSRDSVRGEGAKSSVEWAIRLAATIGQVGSTEGVMLQLIADDGEPLVMPPLPGRRQYLRLLDRLARIRVEGRTSLVDVLDRGVSLVPQGGTLVVIFSQLDLELERLEAVRARLRRRSIQPVAFLLDGAFETAGTLEQACSALRAMDVVVQTHDCHAEPA